MTDSGQNRFYIEELYDRYRADPQSVSPAWRDYFADYPPSAATGEPPPADAAAAAAPPAAVPVEPGVEPLRGAAARLAENMAESLAVPTATSARTIAVKVLEENRRLINQHQTTVAGPKVSLTHLIAWAVVRALERHPELNACFVQHEGRPHRIARASINLGLAVDVERRGRHALLVPNIRRAERLDFPAFVAACDERVAGARLNKLAVDAYQDTTVTLTNPGSLGTALSIPRLLAGQGAIIGAGAIGHPAEYAGVSPETISELALSKVMTVTCTYDHRIIQGAESGAFLATLEWLLQGEDRFYRRIFGELGVPHEPLRWSGDRNPQRPAHPGGTEAIAKQAGVLQLMRAYRVRGHLWADVDPLGYNPEPHPELELSHYGLTVWDLDRRFIAGGLGGSHGTLTLREILDTLRNTYCRHIGVEYMHIQDPQSRHWLQEWLERPEASAPLPRDEQMRILEKLNAAEAFETFLGTTYVGQKRFSLEGAETLIPMLDALLRAGAASGVEELVLGMAHRGRLNVVTNVVGRSHGEIFREFEGDLDPGTTHGSGDVRYHLGASGAYRDPGGRLVHVTLAPNPSHLEAVDPVVEGMVRARHDRRGDLGREKVVPLLIHGDAAFAGQGVVAETLNLSQLKGYRTGGTLHIVVNNQIGFTTGPADARSSHYPTDVAKMVRAPIFHVNGDHPEDALRVVSLALAFRQSFKRDVVIDLVCYRRWGHNEADDPSYTHPILYERIQRHRSVRKLYTDQLLRRGDIDVVTAERALEDFSRRLREVHDEVRRARRAAPERARPELEATEGEAGEPAAATRVGRERLSHVLDGLERTPPGFAKHPKLERQLAERRRRCEEGRIDWALAEALAFGTLVLDGAPVRLSGEDSGRGTFSQRHAILYDHRSGEPYVPLAHLAPDQAPFTVFDSLLSEFAVLGFEYGYSADHPEALVAWEAQFGDFANGAQVILDQFIAGAEEKWGQTSGVVLLLPHGYEGQGPEHSSARLERFLQLAARGNLLVAQPSTPAQYFHLLRAQHGRRKPLIVMTPKSLLRHKACISPAAELSDGRFELVLDDPHVADPAAVRRLLLCSGKVFYDLDERRTESALDDVAICRLEQIYPFPGEALARIAQRYARVEERTWVQEEPRNMGAWSYLHERLQDLGAPGSAWRYVGRPRSSSPATGSLRRHQAEQRALLDEALVSPARVAQPGGVRTPSR
jgi:2-oxoglutarate dehydrogenase E1 component